MKKRIIKKIFNNKYIKYEVEKKFPILGWRLIYIDYGLYEAPAIFNSFEEAINFINLSNNYSKESIVVYEQ